MSEENAMGQGLQNARCLYMEGIRDGNPREAIEKYAGAEYVQHSTGVPTGKDGFVEFFHDFLARNPERDIVIHRGFEDGQYVFLHVTQELNGGEAHWVTADIFDTDGEGRMIEHWDIIQAFENDSVSGHSMVDGPTEPTDLHLTEENKRLVERFVEDVLQNGKTELIADYISGETFVQHNPGIADGLEGLGAALDAMAATGTSMVSGEIHRVIGSGDTVVTLSEVDFGGAAMAVIDIYRVASGKIIEHWDVMELVPTPEVARNSGKF